MKADVEGESARPPLSMTQKQRPITFLILAMLVLATAAIVLAWSIGQSHTISEQQRALSQHEQLLNAVMHVHDTVEEIGAANAHAQPDAPTATVLQRSFKRLDLAKRHLDRARVPSNERLHGAALRNVDAHIDETIALTDSIAATSEVGEPITGDQLVRFEQSRAMLESSLHTAIASIREEQQQLLNGLRGGLETLQWVALVGLISTIVLAIALIAGWYVNDRAVVKAHESKEKFDLLAQNIPGVIYLCRNDERYTMLYLNDAVKELTGYEVQEFLDDRVSFVNLFHPDDKPYIATIVDEAIAARRPFQLRYRVRHRSGEWKWVEEVGSGVFRNDELAFLQGVLLDVTARVQAEQRLEQQQRFLRQVIDTNPNFVFAKDRQGRFTLVNRALAEAYGTTVEQLTGRTDADFNPQAEEVEHFRADDLRVMDTGRERVIPEEPVTDSEGRTRWVQTVKRPIRNENGTIDQVLGVATDITGLKRAELLMAGRSRVLERLATGAPINEVVRSLVDAAEAVEPTLKGAMYLIDESTGRVRLAAAPRLDHDTRRAIEAKLADAPAATGSAAARVLSGERVIVADIGAVRDDPCLAVLYDAGIRSAWIEPIHTSEDDLFGIFALYCPFTREPEQSHLEILESCAKIAAIAIQRKRAEDDLRDSQARLRAADRLASIGTLTAGLGHDMNNVLFPLRCHLDMVRWDELDPHTHELLTATRNTVDFLQQLCDGLRLMSSDPSGADDDLNAVTRLGSWWEQAFPLIRGALDHGVELEFDIPAELPPVRVEDHRLTQALLNLVINAGEATDNGAPVRVWARSDRANNTVQIGVTDHGTGMTEEVRQSALDPFFTTKARSLSTGLGLSLVHGIMKHIGGSISIDSEPGRGTTVTLTLPIAGEERESPHSKPQQAVISLSDAHLAAWVSGVLRTSGYDVQRNRSGEPPTGALWVTEPGAKNFDRARRFVDQSSDARVIVLGDAPGQWSDLGAVVVRTVDDLAAIRSAVNEVLCARGVQTS